MTAYGENMSENENETNNYKKPLFNHPRENYLIF